MTRILIGLAAVSAIALAQVDTRRADIRGGGGDGKCTIEVEVDGAAQVTISRGSASLRTLQGNRATWRRFQCNQEFPSNPMNFRFRGIDGRGRQTLVRDPNGNGGRAVVQIEDPQGGSEGYTFDIEWSGSGGNSGGGGWNGGGGGRPPGNGGGWGGGNGNGNTNPAQAVRACSSEAQNQIRRCYNVNRVNIDRIAVDNNAGRNDHVMGMASGRNGNRNMEYNFDCSVDLRTGRIRDVQVQERWRQ